MSAPRASPRLRTPLHSARDAVAEVSGHVDPRLVPSETGPIVYLWVDDLSEAVARIRARFRDPGGNVLGVYQEP